MNKQLKKIKAMSDRVLDSQIKTAKEKGQDKGEYYDALLKEQASRNK